ncbi:MAG: PQQ-binding-like beta-propeller repeat protein [Phycisphaerales bacterium]|nr:MAG: PQQ-binding-like beta-propeller repeat protein [Phycisphaerales bacterium]
MKAAKLQFWVLSLLVSTIMWWASPFAAAQPLPPELRAEPILKACDIKGGLIVHIGCGNGRLTAALRAGDSYLVHGLDPSQSNIERVRAYLQSIGIYGPVSVEKLKGTSLPYIDNLVNLVVSQDLGVVPMSEVMRVLCPNGVAYIRKNSQWVKTVKPRSTELDEWTHYLHDASNNAVSHDQVVAPPRRMQWVGSPRYARHHDRMSSVSAAVTAGGRVFYIMDEASHASILIPPKWALIARDAFNGTVLWKRPIGKWFTHLWPLKSGPAQLPRRLVTDGQRVYGTLSLDSPLTALDAATGETLRMYEGTGAAEEVILSDGVLFVLVNDAVQKPDYDGSGRFAKGAREKFWDEAPRKLAAVRAESGEILWATRHRVLPGTLAADKQRVVFHDGLSVVCLDRKTGDDIWRSTPIARADEIRSFYIPILVLYEDVVLFSGGETAGLQTGSWYTSGKDTMTALSAETGEVLWTAYHPPSGYRSPEDMLVANGLVWTGETTSGRAVGVFTGRDPRTGDVKSEFSPNVEIYWFHHRCYRGKATDNYLLVSRAGTEFVDVHNEQWIPNHWTRGACLYGVMPANGLLYNPPHPCACYLESKLYGFNALAPASTSPRITGRAGSNERLEKGPAYRQIENLNSKIENPDEWPTYRHDAARSGRASTTVPPALKRAWHAGIGGRLTSPIVADGKVFVASVDSHTLHVLDAASGEKLWRYTTGGRIDSPPTFYQGQVLFGSTDGWVYCLDASDGALLWRFLAAPVDQRLTAFEQLESVWPVHGSVLIKGDVLYCVAGRSMFLDDGLRVLRLDARTGRLLSETVLDDREPATGKDLHTYVSWLNMPPALPDVLSSDGRYIYMRSQPFNLDGTRLPLEKMPAGQDADKGAPPATQHAEYAHLFSPTGFLDDAYWHRTYWMYGSTFVSGWCGYFLAGKEAPAGKILVFDDSKVYGFGRKPQYYRWTTPIEHQLFAASKGFSGSVDGSSDRSLISIEKSDSLNPAGKPLTVEAWVKADRPGGVILAHGGSNHGYALYLQGGRPRFAVRIRGEAASVVAKARVVGKWVHLAGVLTGEELQIYVQGKLAGSAKAPGYIAADPQEAMEIGADEGSIVADYTSPFGLAGLADEVRIYHRALSAVEISSHTSSPGKVDEADLALRYSFDKGDASDASGNGNNGKVDGAVSVRGKFGRAMKFTGAAASVPGFAVKHNWTVDMPVIVRAMVLAGGTLFVAGPPDLVDESEAFRQINDLHVKRNLAEQAAALDGRKGALLMAVSAADGTELARYDVDCPPVFDGMAAASGRLYMATVNGGVLCFRPDK